MSAMKDKMIDKMNADREAEASKKKPIPERKCKNCTYALLPGGCVESLGSDDTCPYHALPER